MASGSYLHVQTLQSLMSGQEVLAVCNGALPSTHSMLVPCRTSSTEAPTCAGTRMDSEPLEEYEQQPGCMRGLLAASSAKHAAAYLDEQVERRKEGVLPCFAVWVSVLVVAAASCLAQLMHQSLDVLSQHARALRLVCACV